MLVVQKNVTCAEISWLKGFRRLLSSYCNIADNLQTRTTKQNKRRACELKTLHQGLRQMLYLSLQMMMMMTPQLTPVAKWIAESKHTSEGKLKPPQPRKMLRYAPSSHN